MVTVEILFAKQYARKNECVPLGVAYDKERFREYARLIVNGDDELLITDVYFVLFYTYYSLVVNEQADDWLFMRFLWHHTRYKRRSTKLYFDIVCGNMIVDGRDISSLIRREMFGFIVT